MKISVVVPTLNEERCIAATLDSVLHQDPPFEIIVTDGGSHDRTREIASASARVVAASPGRATQMNEGATAATGEVLLFLHADTVLPPGALKIVRQTLADHGVNAGCFRLRFDRHSPMLRFYSWCTTLRWHRIVFGDRALFVRRAVFDHLGGFPEQPIFEDVDFVRALHRGPGRLAYLPESVTTSARRFSVRGTLLQQAANLILWTLHAAGVAPARLAKYYPPQSSIADSSSDG